MFSIEKVYSEKSGLKTLTRRKVITIKKQEGHSGPESLTCTCAQSYSVLLNHLVEGNQAGLFCSLVFERITRPYPLPHHTQTFSTYQILRLLHNKYQGSRLCGFREDFSCLPYMILYKTCDAQFRTIFDPCGNI